MEIINLTGEPASDNRSIVLRGVGYNIGLPVFLWNHPMGHDGYTKEKVVIEEINAKTGKITRRVIKGARYKKRVMYGNPVDAITQLFIHHSGGDGADPSGMYKTLYMDRGLSVHFAGEDDGRWWQFNDMVDCCWHAGRHNKISIGTELCLFPLVSKRPRYYDVENRKRTRNLPHDTRYDTIHGVTMEVFVMPEPQWRALARVYAGAWVALGHQRTKGFEGPFDRSPVFPRNKFTGKIPMTVSADGIKHVGLFTHFQATERKIDPCGFPPLEEFEKVVAEYYGSFRGNL